MIFVILRYFKDESMKTEQVTYDIFLQSVEQMRKNGEKLTVRNVLSQTGGSFGKISVFLKRFEQEQAHLSLMSHTDISDTLRQAVLSEIGRFVAEAKSALDKQVLQLTAHLDEANAQLTEQEQAMSSLKEEATALKDKLMLAEQSISDLESFNKDCKQQLEDAQNEKGLSITDAAKSKLQLERADKDLLELKEHNKTLQAQLNETTKEKYDAEKKAAVAEAKLEQKSKSS